MLPSSLHHRVLEAARRTPDAVAVRDPSRGAVTYAELDRASARVRDWLRLAGVTTGDRVGICLGKSVESLALMLGALRCGAAYVPIDVTSPAWRVAFILADCGVRLAVVDAGRLDEIRDALPPDVAERVRPAALDPVPGAGLEPLLAPRATDAIDVAVPASALGYILYTSGSTGTPKGVMISHAAALAFVDWCVARFQPAPEDRFSSHAPFHFDLSVLDLYVPLTTGASVLLIDDELGKEPQRLATAMAEYQVTVWYSTPSILTMLARHGRLERHDLSALRLVLFAGEVFPMPALRLLQEKLPTPSYHNLYGPTETNVCTAFALPVVDDHSRATPWPIGVPCAHYRARVVDSAMREVPPGEQGELLIAGVGVMSGYWNNPERAASAFAELDGERWYRTGDLVSWHSDLGFEFHGRADRMVKRRGYRIELGEIEAALSRHSAIAHAAVVATTAPDGSVRISAFLTAATEDRPTVLALKQAAASLMPKYMAPDQYTWLDQLPQTSTDKVDLQALAALARGAATAVG